jgi:hypothetical protein
MRLSRTGPFLLLLSAMLAVSCGAATSAPRSTKSPQASATSGQPSGAPKQRATADARAILGEFVPPTGAVRLTKPPKLPSGSGTLSLNSTTAVDEVEYWRVTGSATALQAWEKAHISRSFSRQDVIIGPPDWNTVYSLPAVPGVLSTREMNVQFYDVGGGMTVIMADAMVSWQPPRPASEVIPAAASVVTVAASGPWSGNPAPVTITSVPVVRKLAALIDGLPVSTVGAGAPCPLGVGFTLTFRDAVGGPAVAVATGPAECGVVHLRLNSNGSPDLQPPGSYRATVLKIADLHWKLD